MDVDSQVLQRSADLCVCMHVGVFATVSMCEKYVCVCAE
jgi:hypothetical protein